MICSNIHEGLDVLFPIQQCILYIHPRKSAQNRGFSDGAYIWGVGGDAQLRSIDWGETRWFRCMDSSDFHAPYRWGVELSCFF